MDQPPFFSSQPFGGNIDFRFMKKPWAKINTVQLAPDEVKTPGSMQAGCWLHVNMVNGGDKEAYEQELNRWYAVISQTFIVNPENERTRHWEMAVNGSAVEIVDFHRNSDQERIYSDGGDEEYRRMESLASLSLEATKLGKPVAVVTGSQGDPEKSVDEAWGTHLDEIWAGTPGHGLAFWVHREDDEPGITMSHVTSLDKMDYLSKFPPLLKNHLFKLTRCTGEDNFVTWFWLYRRQTANDEVQRPDIPDYDAPCIVLVGSIDWRVTHDYTFTWNPQNPLSPPTLNRGTTGTVFVNPTNPNNNWQYFTLIHNPTPTYEFPSKAQFQAQFNNPTYSFPDLRLNSSINKWTYYALKKRSNANADFTKPSYFSHSTRAPVKDAKIQVKEPKHSYNILNPEEWYPGKPATD